MKSLQAPNLKTIALTKAMYTAICSDDEQEFDKMSEESEEKKRYRGEIIASCSKSMDG